MMSVMAAVSATAEVQIDARTVAVAVVMKCQFGYRKVRYRGIVKNGAQVFSLLALANLYLARRTLASA